MSLEAIQLEAATLVRFLESTQKKVEGSSAEDLKENYLSAIKVGRQTAASRRRSDEQKALTWWTGVVV